MWNHAKKGISSFNPSQREESLTIKRPALCERENVNVNFTEYCTRTFYKFLTRPDRMNFLNIHFPTELDSQLLKRDAFIRTFHKERNSLSVCSYCTLWYPVNVLYAAFQRASRRLSKEDFRQTKRFYYKRSAHFAYLRITNF